MPLRIERGEDRIVNEEGVRSPHLFQLRNGDILMTFHVQSDMHFAKRKCFRSTDKGQTFQEDPQRNHREMAWGQLSNGAVLAFDRDTFEKEQGVMLGMYHRSDDGGKTFTGPHIAEVNINRTATSDYPLSPEQYPEKSHPQCDYFQPIPEFYRPVLDQASHRRGFTFWRYIFEHEGRLLNAMQGRFHADRGSRTVLVASEDEGKTWNYVTTIAYDHDPRIQGMSEPVLRQVADGSLLCIMRRGGREPLAQCRSTDGGQTWSEPELLAGWGVDPDLYLMSNGVLACTFGRPGLHIMFSEDGCGYAWGYHTVIGEWSSSTYMGITEIAPDTLLLAYDAKKSEDPALRRCDENCYIAATTLTVEQYEL